MDRKAVFWYQCLITQCMVLGGRTKRGVALNEESALNEVVLQDGNKQYVTIVPRNTQYLCKDRRIILFFHQVLWEFHHFWKEMLGAWKTLSNVSCLNFDNANFYASIFADRLCESESRNFRLKENFQFIEMEAKGIVHVRKDRPLE